MGEKTTVSGIETFHRRPSGLDTDDRLSACPFCGHPAAIRISEHGATPSAYENHPLSVECTNTSCAVSTPRHYATRETAIEAWNRRAPPTTE